MAHSHDIRVLTQEQLRRFGAIRTANDAYYLGAVVNFLREHIDCLIDIQANPDDQPEEGFTLDHLSQRSFDSLLVDTLYFFVRNPEVVGSGMREVAEALAQARSGKGNGAFKALDLNNDTLNSALEDVANLGTIRLSFKVS